MKAMCYIGSNSLESRCFHIGTKLKRKLEKKGIIVDSFSSKESTVLECIECHQCFTRGECPIDQKDDMPIIRRKMLESDLIIWISPVYLNNLSGAMKTYIDRITSWVHTLHLLGKIGVVITVTDRSGQEFVSFYLKNILRLMGCNVIGEYKFVKVENVDIEYKLEEIIDDITSSIINESQYKSTDELEKRFQINKREYINPDNEKFIGKNYEVTYWYNSEMSKCNTYQEVLDKRKAEKE